MEYSVRATQPLWIFWGIIFLLQLQIMRYVIHFALRLVYIFLSEMFGLASTVSTILRSKHSAENDVQTSRRRPDVKHKSRITGAVWSAPTLFVFFQKA